VAAPVAALLALASALSFGSGDFLGGLAARQVRTTSVLLWSYLLSGSLLVVASAATGGSPSLRDLVIGSGAGLLGAAGIGLLYQALAVGQMSAIAPVTALLAAAIPVTAGFLQGEDPGPSPIAGMALAVVAVVLVSAEGGGSLRPSDARGVTLALAAGVCFGLFYVGVASTDDGSGLWPLLGARAASIVLVGGLALLGVIHAPAPRGRPAAWTAGAGVLDGAGNVLYLLAVREGLISVGTVLSSLYPVATVALAWAVLRERFAPLQRVGMVVALPAIALLTL
jgi:drug/metabolite transporter (DMT)-like permease